MDATRAFHIGRSHVLFFCHSFLRWLLQTKCWHHTQSNNQKLQSNECGKKTFWHRLALSMCSFHFRKCNCFTNLHLFCVLLTDALLIWHVNFNEIFENFSSPLCGPWNDGLSFQQPNPKDAMSCPMSQTKRSYHQMTKQRHWWSASDHTNVFVGYHSWFRHESISIRSMSCLYKTINKNIWLIYGIFMENLF